MSDIEAQRDEIASTNANYIDDARCYLSQLDRGELLTLEEERELADRICAGAFAEMLLQLQDPETSAQTHNQTVETLNKLPRKGSRALHRTPEDIVKESNRLDYFTQTARPELQNRQGEKIGQVRSGELKELTVDGRQAAHFLIYKNLAMAVTIANRYFYLPTPLDDRIQDANLGLLRAVEQISPHSPHKFSTHAVPWMRQSVVREYDNNERFIRIPVAAVKQIRKLQKAEKDLTESLGRTPTHEELVMATKLKPEQISELQTVLRTSFRVPHSFNQPLPGNPDDEVMNLEDILVAPDQEGLYTTVAMRFMTTVLHQAFDAAFPANDISAQKQKWIVQFLHHMIPEPGDTDASHTLYRACQELAISETNARHLYDTGLRRLREYLVARDITEILL